MPWLLQGRVWRCRGLWIESCHFARKKLQELINFHKTSHHFQNPTSPFENHSYQSIIDTFITNYHSSCTELIDRFLMRFSRSGPTRHNCKKTRNWFEDFLELNLKKYCRAFLSFRPKNWSIDAVLKAQRTKPSLSTQVNRGLNPTTGRI